MQRDKQARRRIGQVHTRRRVLVICGGTKTEPTYFQGLKRHVKSPAVVVVRPKSDSPENLVRYATGERDRNRDQFDEVWCVFDVDEFVLDEAVKSAQRHGIELAVSNPCFELWLLLHHEDCRCHVDGPEDAKRRLKKCLPGYDKTRLKFEDFAAGVRDAMSGHASWVMRGIRRLVCGGWRCGSLVRKSYE